MTVLEEHSSTAQSNKVAQELSFLVTGGAGYIGSNLIKELKQVYPKAKIVSLDNYSSGSIKNHIDGVEYINGNTGDINDIVELKEFSPSHCFHFGEFSRIGLSFQKTKETFLYNTFGTQQVLEYCINHNTKIIYSSSSAVLDDPDNSPYTWTKSKNIELIKNYSKWFGLKYIICYFYNVYGKNQISDGDYKTVIGLFQQKFLQKMSLPVVFPGTQSRKFTYIDDVINGLMMLLRRGDGDHYYLSSDHDVDIVDLAKAFGGRFHYIDPEFLERKVSTVPIDNRMTTELGWTTTIDILDYIKKFISDHENLED